MWSILHMKTKLHESETTKWQRIAKPKGETCAGKRSSISLWSQFLAPKVSPYRQLVNYNKLRRRTCSEVMNSPLIPFVSIDSRFCLPSFSDWHKLEKSWRLLIINLNCLEKSTCVKKISSSRSYLKGRKFLRKIFSLEEIPRNLSKFIYVFAKISSAKG